MQYCIIQHGHKFFHLLWIRNEESWALINNEVHKNYGNQLHKQNQMKVSTKPKFKHVDLRNQGHAPLVTEKKREQKSHEPTCINITTLVINNPPNYWGRATSVIVLLKVKSLNDWTNQSKSYEEIGKMHWRISKTLDEIGAKFHVGGKFWGDSLPSKSVKGTSICNKINRHKINTYRCNFGNNVAVVWNRCLQREKCRKNKLPILRHCINLNNNYKSQLMKIHN